jgi:hypothetical protein
MGIGGRQNAPFVEMSSLSDGKLFGFVYAFLALPRWYRIRRSLPEEND